MAKPTHKNTTMTKISYPVAMADALRQYCEDHQMVMAAYIRKAISEKLERDGVEDVPHLVSHGGYRGGGTNGKRKQKSDA